MNLGCDDDAGSGGGGLVVALGSRSATAPAEVANEVEASMHMRRWKGSMFRWTGSRNSSLVSKCRGIGAFGPPNGRTAASQWALSAKRHPPAPRPPPPGACADTPSECGAECGARPRAKSASAHERHLCDMLHVQVSELLDAVAINLGEQPALVQESEAVAQPPLERGAARQQHEGVRAWIHGVAAWVHGAATWRGRVAGRSMRARAPAPRCDTSMSFSPWACGEARASTSRHSISACTCDGAGAGGAGVRQGEVGVRGGGVRRG
jgi:hypothetical protein